MLSEVPEGWTATPFEQLATLQSGFAFKSANFVDDDSVGLPIIRIRDLEKQSPVKFYDGDVPDEYIVEKGDVLIGMDGEFNCVEWRANSGALNQRVLRVYETEKTARKFLLYRLIPILKDLEGKISGTTVKHLSVKHLKALSIPTPPLNEQHRIAEILASVDASIQATQAVIEQAERVKRGLMEELLTGGLGSEAIERGEVPEGWDSDELKECLSKVIDYRGKAPPKSASGIPLITAKNIRKGFLSFEADEYIDEEQYEDWMVKGLPQAGDVMFTTEAPLGNVAKFPSEGVYALGQRVITLRCNERLESSYLFYLLQSKHMQAEIQLRATGSTAKGIKSKEFQKIKVPFPNTAEQLRIAQILSSFDASIAKQKNILEQHLQAKRGLMDDLLTGRVRTV